MRTVSSYSNIIVMCQNKPIILDFFYHMNKRVQFKPLQFRRKPYPLPYTQYQLPFHSNSIISFPFTNPPLPFLHRPPPASPLSQDRSQHIHPSILESKQKMQLKFHQSPHYSSLKLLHKATSLPSFTDTASSSHSIDSSDEPLRKLAVKWILAYTKKVARDTQYLAVAYLHRLPNSVSFTEENHELLAATLLLIASKINEVYPPKITSLLARCQHPANKEEIISLQARLTAALDYDLALNHTPYSQVASILGALHSERLSQCEKLLRMVAGNREVWSAGDETLAYAVVYLILPQFVKEMRLRNNQKVKALAITIYNLYQTSKEQYEREKENRGK